MLVTLNLNASQIYILMKCLKEHFDVLSMLPYEDCVGEIKEINNIIDQLPMGVWEVWDNAREARENG